MENADDEERRKLKRRNLSYYLPVVNNNNQQIIGHLVDISLKGLMIDSKRSIPTGQDFNLHLDLAENMADKTAVNFVARSKWCRADKIQPFLYNAGFEIISISPADAEVIQKLFEKFGTMDSSFSFQ